MSFVTRGVTIKFVDERADREMTFYFEGGITAFVRYLNRNREGLHSVVHVEKEVENIGIEAAIQYTDSYTESVYSFAVVGEMPTNSIAGVESNSIFSFLQAEERNIKIENVKILLNIEAIDRFVIIQ